MEISLLLLLLLQLLFPAVPWHVFLCRLALSGTAEHLSIALENSNALS